MPLETQPPSTAGKLSSRAVYLIYLVATLATLVPSIYYPFPLAVDYLNHLSRLFIFDNLNDPFLGKVFEAHFGIIPNIALDLVGLVSKLLHIAPNIALKSFFVLSAATLWVGIIECHRAVHGTIRQSVLLLVPVSYSFVFNVGFYDFAFGMGLAFLFLAWMIRSRPRPLISIPAINALAALLFFCHFGAFVIMVAALFLYRVGSGQRILRAGYLGVAESILPAVLFMLAQRSGVHLLMFSTLVWKLFGFVSLFGTVSEGSSLLAAILVTGFVSILLAQGSIKLRQPWRSLVIGFGLLALFVPFSVQVSYYVDWRLIWMTVILFFICIEIDFRRFWIEPAILGIVFALFVVGMKDLTTETRQYNKDVEEFRQASSVIPKDSFVFVSSSEASPCTDNKKDGNGLTNHTSDQVDVDKMYYRFVPALLTLDRMSIQPQIFANPGAEAVIYRKEYKAYFSVVPSGPPDSLLSAMIATDSEIPLTWEGNNLSNGSEVGLRQYMVDWPSRFPYVIHLHKDCPAASPYAPLFQEIGKGSFFDIYRTDRGPNGAPLAFGH